MSITRFEDSLLGKLLYKHKLGCMLPFFLFLFAILAYFVWRNWDSILEYFG